MIGALLYLRLTALRNLVVHKLRRLRQPKYLIGAVSAAAYLYYFVIRRVGGVPMGVPTEGAQTAGMLGAGLVGALLCLIGLVRVAYAWIAPPEKAGLAFTEAEIAFLFAAPVSRRALIHYRLLSTQGAILFSAVVITVVFNRAGYLGGHRALHAVGWWIILATADLHVNGTNLMLSGLRERSPRFLLWRLAGVAAIVMYVVAVYFAAVGYVGAFMSGPGGMSAGADRLVAQLHHSSALSWLTFPFRVLLGPYLATGYREFAVALPPALAVVVLHYWWVASSNARFEEGSIAIAARRAAMRSALQRGESPRFGGSKPKALAGPFPLPPRGLPEVAFLWKNLLSLRSAVFGRRTLGIVVGMAIWMYLISGPFFKGRSSPDGGAMFGLFLLMCCAVAAAYTLILGPQIARQDLRNDLPNADLLKTFPLEGWRLALGELLAPTAILTTILWVIILAAAACLDTGRRLEWLTPGVRGTGVACLGLVAPLLCMIQLLVPNTVMILMPAWYQASRSRSGGIEMFGQRLLFGVLQLLFALLVALPAAGAAVLVYIASFWEFGIPAGEVLATVAAVLILAGEAAVGLWFLGERFERFDLSTESR